METQRENGTGTEKRLNPSYSLDAQTQETERVKASDVTEEDKYNIEFDERGPVGSALRNHIIMKMIVNCLNDGELDSWYESCMFVKKIIDEMGDSIWTGRVDRKLVVWEGILSLEAETMCNYLRLQELPDEWDRKSAREQFNILKTPLDEYVKMIKEKVESFVQRDFIVEAAFLAYHGLLGSIGCLDWDCDFPNGNDEYCPTENLCALVASVTGSVNILDIDQYDTMDWNLKPSRELLANLGSILANIKCETLTICLLQSRIETEVTEVLVRAMQSGVKKVNLDSNDRHKDDPIDIAALTKYDGKGTCEEIFCNDPIVDAYLEEIQKWTQRINWDTEFSLAGGHGVVKEYEKGNTCVTIRRKSNEREPREK